MKKRMDSEERNRIISLAIDNIEKRGERPDYKNVAKETGFSETYIFKIISKEKKKPKGQRIPKIIKLKTHHSAKERVNDIIKIIKKMTDSGNELSYQLLAQKMNLSESYVYKLCQKYNIEQRVLLEKLEEKRKLETDDKISTSSSKPEKMKKENENYQNSPNENTAAWEVKDDGKQ